MGTLCPVGERRDTMKDKNPLEDEGPREERRPPRRGNYPLESPFYEEEFDPYFLAEQDVPSPEDADRVEDPEEDWYWREPENYWLEEGMWPWPEPPKRRTRSPQKPEPS
jgi:hypothetical protein